MERIGIFGGTFNPPHIGHIQAAEQAMARLNLDRLLLIPAGSAPHKSLLPPGSASPEQRLEMLRLSASPRMEVSDMEILRDGKSYTWETVRCLRQCHPDAKLYLLLGSDMFLTFLDWRAPEEIWGAAALAVLCRGDSGEMPRISAQAARLRELGAEVTLVENTAVPISSTQMRRLLAFGCAEEFLNPPTAAYIRAHGLYDTGENWKHLPMAELESIVIRLLNPNRVAHVLGCRDTAVALAERWGADVTDAARAGILHDVTKALDGPLQLTLCRSYGKILDNFSRKYPKTLHALTGSLVAQRIFGENEAVVSAICSHTTGKPNMNTLEKIIYVADYMEPNRDFPGVERLRTLAYQDLDGALKLGLEMTLEHLAWQGAEVSPASREALAWLNR